MTNHLEQAKHAQGTGPERPFESGVEVVGKPACALPVQDSREGVDRRFADAVLACFDISGMDGFARLHQPAATA